MQATVLKIGVGVHSAGHVKDSPEGHRENTPFINDFTFFHILFKISSF